MTPEEKARELLLMYYELIPMNTISFAKQCALIAVDEILYYHFPILNGVKPTTHIYWEEVKQEIEKL